MEDPAKTFTGYVTRTQQTALAGAVELSVSCVPFGILGAKTRPGLCVGREGVAG